MHSVTGSSSSTESRWVYLQFSLCRPPTVQTSPILLLCDTLSPFHCSFSLISCQAPVQIFLCMSGFLLLTQAVGAVSTGSHVPLIAVEGLFRSRAPRQTGIEWWIPFQPGIGNTELYFYQEPHV